MLWKHKKTAKDRVSNFDKFHGDLAEALVEQDPVPAADSGQSLASEDDTAAANGQIAAGSEPAGNELETVQDQDPEQLPEEEIQYLKDVIHRQVINKVDLNTIGKMRDEDLRLEIRRNAEMTLDNSASFLTREEREKLINEVIDETFGLGPLEPLFRDESITDIMINGAKQVYIEKKGRLELSKVKFANDAHVIRIIQRIVGAVGRRIDETSPMVDGRLKDGSRINAVIPPLALDGPLVSIRRFGSHPLQAANLLENGSITREMLEFLQACVQGRINVLISGGTGSGKTTLLNILSRSINSYERVATIEDAAELQLQQSHVIRMETRPANIEGEGEVTTRDLVKNALRMRPDRIIVGECRGPEALDMLQAMNTGHDGSLTTVHANTPRDALMRLEMMVGMTGVDIPVWTIRRQIASAINIVIQSVRLTGGPRKIVSISEITGMEGEIISMHEIFRFQQTGLDDNGVAEGYFESTGVRPQCAARLQASGLPLDLSTFEKQRLAVAQPVGETA
jgi:pilus assembly protein CpaF